MKNFLTFVTYHLKAEDMRENRMVSESITILRGDKDPDEKFLEEEKKQLIERLEQQGYRNVAVENYSTDIVDATRMLDHYKNSFNTKRTGAY